MNPFGWIGAGLVFLAMWLVGNQRRSGFLVGAVAEGFWLAYSYAIGSIELGVMACIYAGVHLRNYFAWRSK